jgi:hypothetical protein
VGHFVLLIGFDGTHYLLHDPGKPGLKNRKVTKGHFLKALAYPDDDAKNFVAVSFKQRF